MNARFRRMLLDDPATALAHGYNGEVFDIRPDEQAQVLAMRADTLAEFAAQLLERLWYVRLDARRRGTQETTNGVDQALLRREGPHRPKLGQDEARLRAHSSMPQSESHLTLCQLPSQSPITIQIETQQVSKRRQTVHHSRQCANRLPTPN